MSRGFRFIVAGVLAGIAASAPQAASAQGSDARVIGRQGATQISFQAIVAGSVVETATPITNSRGVVTGVQSGNQFQGIYFGAWDIGYFTSEHFVFKFGNQFSGAFNSGSAKPSVSGNIGGIYYFTPQNTASLYASGAYSFRMTNRSPGDRGDAIGSLGLQAAVRNNASVFFEGGFGRSLNTGGQSVILSSVGLRILF